MFFLIIALWLVCFWEKLVTLLPLDDQILVIFGQAPEIFLLFGVLWLQASRSPARGSFRGLGGGLDALLAIFIGWILLSSLIAQNAAGPFASPDPFLSFINVKALIRYFAVFYLASRIVWDEKKARTIRNTILLIVAIQVVIGLLQVVFGRPALEFFAPRSLSDVFGRDREAFVDRETTGIEIFGTFRVTISYAYLLMIGAITVMVSRVRLGPIGPRGISAILLLMIFFSGSRIVLLLTAAVYFTYFVNLKIGKLSRARVLAASLAGVTVVAGLYTYALSLDLDYETGTLGYILTPDYIEAAMNGRLGVMVVILPQLMDNPQFFVGYGADWTFITSNLIQAERIANYALVATLEKTIEDVYWVALLLYYGAIGMVFFVLFLVKLYKRLSQIFDRHTGWIADMAETARMLFLVNIILNFVNQAFEVQTNSLLLWAFVGIAITAARQAERERRVGPVENVAAVPFGDRRHAVA